MKRLLSSILSLLLLAAVFSASAFTLDKEKAQNAVWPDVDAESMGVYIYDGVSGLDVVGKYDGSDLFIKTKPVPEDVNVYAISRFSGYELIDVSVEEMGLTADTIGRLRLGRGFIVTDLEQGDIGVYSFPVLDGNKILFIFTVYTTDDGYHVTFGRPNLYNALNNSYGIEGPIEMYRTEDGYATVDAKGEVYVTYIFRTSCAYENPPENVAAKIKAEVLAARAEDSEQYWAGVLTGPNCLLSDSAHLQIVKSGSMDPPDYVISSFTGPSYSAATYYVDPTNSYYNYDDGLYDTYLPPAPAEDAAALILYLARYGWSLSGTDTYPPEELTYPSVSSDKATAAALAAYKPDGYKIDLKDGVYGGALYSQSIPGFVDRLSIIFEVYVKSGTVKGAVLICCMQDGPHSIHLMSDSEGRSSYRAVYPLGTSLETIQQNAAEYFSEYGNAPFNETAALEFFGGRRVSSEYQEELSALFSWTKTRYTFLCCRFASNEAFKSVQEMQSASREIYPAIYACGGTALTVGEASSLFFDCYYSENIYAFGKNYYAVDFCARIHQNYPDPEEPSAGAIGSDHAWLTWLVVKPLVKNQNGTLDRFYYAADTPQWIIAYDMKTYFEDPVNGKSLLSAKE